MYHPHQMAGQKAKTHGKQEQMTKEKVANKNTLVFYIIFLWFESVYFSDAEHKNCTIAENIPWLFRFNFSLDAQSETGS